MRHGPRVKRDSFDDLDAAIDAVRSEAIEVAREGPLEPAEGFRTYGPGDRVAARIELSTGGLLRGREAGVDVMGDGSLIPYRGVIRKERLEGRTPDAALQSVREALA